MINISLEVDHLKISSDSNKILAPIIKNWLIKNGFELNREKKIYVFFGKVDEIFLEKIHTFLSVYEIEISLDAHCKSMLEKIDNERKDYESLVDQALKIKKLARDTGPFKVPRMKDGADLYWYQRMPILHAVTLENSANFSVPGSGKTWMAYSTFFMLKEKNIVNKLLVIAPLAAFKPWEIEYKEITGEMYESKIERLTGTPDERTLKFRSSEKYEIYLVNYSIAGIENFMIQELLQSDNFLVVIDESHHIKNIGANRTQNVLKLSRFAKRRMILTGTMMPKELFDVWTQFQFLYPEHNRELLGSALSFEIKSRELNAIPKYSEILSPYFTRISKDMLDLPKPIFNPTNGGNPHVVKMGSIQRRIYDAVRGRMREDIANFRNDSFALRDYAKKAIVYLIEISTDPALIKHNTQFDTADLESLHMSALEMLENYPRLKDEPHNKYKKAVSLAQDTLQNGGKVIVWTNFTTSIKKLEKYFNSEGYKCVLIYGAIPKDEEENENFNRESEIEKFKTSNDYNVLIANPASLAESVSLHKQCHHAIYVDRTYNGGHYIQSLERIHRVGLDKNIETRYDIIESEDSIDQEIEYSLRLKKRNMDNFFNSSDLMVQDLGSTSEDEDSLSSYSNPMGNKNEEKNDIIQFIEHVNKKTSDDK